MTTLSGESRQAEIAERVDFAVPAGGTIGPRFPFWREAVDHARGRIQRHEYRGRVIRRDSPDFHPRRHFQEDNTLVVYSRAFVHIRVTTRPLNRAGRPISRTDGVACTWEVFRAGAVETCPETRNGGPEVPEEEQAAARQLESSGHQILDRRWESAGGRLDTGELTGPPPAGRAPHDAPGAPRCRMADRPREAVRPGPA